MTLKKKYLLSTHIDTLDLQNKRVLLRADLNIPMAQNKLICDHKIRALLPTIDMLKKKGAKIILITHLGRPKKQAPEFSTKLLTQWFENNRYPIVFADNIQESIQKSYTDMHHILMIENLRFFPEEKKQSITFAHLLSQLGDYFVNDAFGALHNHDTSLTILPKLFPKNKRFIGPLIEKELYNLNKLTAPSAHPFLLILGGGKVASKIPILTKLIEKVNTLLLCPAIVFTFSKYLGKRVGKSLVADKALTDVPHILAKAKQLQAHILFPSDYQIAQGSFDGPISSIDSQDIPDNYVGISIGPNTINQFIQEIQKAKTIFFNGAFGNEKKKETLNGMQALIDAMAKSQAFTVIGGGDSVCLAYRFGIANAINYFSTGGGAALTYISGEKLPGLQAFDMYPS